MTRLKYLDPADGQYKLLPVGGGGGGATGPNEVFVGTSDPGTSTGFELWYDTDAVDPYYGQGVMRFANAAARTAALPSPVEGMVTWLLDIHQMQAFHRGSWIPAGGVLPAFRGRLTSGPYSIVGGAARWQVNFTTEKKLYGGIAESTVDRTFIVPATGVYQFSAGITFLGIAQGTSVQSAIGDLTGIYIWGSAHHALANGYAYSVASGIAELAAGNKVSLWTNVTQACYVESSFLFINWVGGS